MQILMEPSKRMEGETYYTDEMIRDVLLQGIADVDIRREALSVLGFEKSPFCKGGLEFSSIKF